MMTNLNVLEQFNIQIIPVLKVKNLLLQILKIRLEN
jgi:hypothetical protein